MKPTAHTRTDSHLRDSAGLPLLLTALPVANGEYGNVNDTYSDDSCVECNARESEHARARSHDDEPVQL